VVSIGSKRIDLWEFYVEPCLEIRFRDLMVRRLLGNEPYSFHHLNGFPAPDPVRLSGKVFFVGRPFSPGRIFYNGRPDPNDSQQAKAG